MPHFLGTGSHYYDNEHYRFLVLPRFGLDIEKVFIRHGRKFHVKTAFTLASYVVSNRFLYVKSARNELARDRLCELFAFGSSRMSSPARQLATDPLHFSTISF